VPGIGIVRVSLGLRLQVPDEVLNAHSAASAVVVGRELARQADEYVRAQALGYYPPLDYLRDREAVDRELVEAARAVAWLAGELAQETVRRRLRAVFSQVVLESQQSVAFTMPGVRPTDAAPREALARHFTPDTVKLTLTVSALHRRPDPGGAEQFARRMAWRWLKEHFASMDVTSAQAVRSAS
jgi:hypothetical protein